MPLKMPLKMSKMLLKMSKNSIFLSQNFWYKKFRTAIWGSLLEIMPLATFSSPVATNLQEEATRCNHPGQSQSIPRQPWKNHHHQHIFLSVSSSSWSIIILNLIVFKILKSYSSMSISLNGQGLCCTFIKMDNQTNAVQFQNHLLWAFFAVSLGTVDSSIIQRRWTNNVNISHFLSCEGKYRNGSFLTWIQKWNFSRWHKYRSPERDCAESKP